jgi:DNA-binding NarL/FixJ family response regulator
MFAKSGDHHNVCRGELMSNIRILIRDSSKMLQDILEQAISNEPDMNVIAEPDVPDLPIAHERLSPDVVVVGPGDSNSDVEDGARNLLARWPGSCVLMITARGHKVLMYELLPRRVDLGEISPTQLTQVIRSAVHQKHTPDVNGP